VAHTSYVAHIQATDAAWPALEGMRLLDPHSFQFTGNATISIIRRCSMRCSRHFGPKLEGRPQALLAHRLIDVAIAAIGFAALLGLGLVAQFPRQEFYAYAVPLACIPALAPIAGAVNNDNLAFLGGAAATLGVWQLVATRTRRLACGLHSRASSPRAGRN